MYFVSKSSNSQMLRYNYRFYLLLQAGSIPCGSMVLHENKKPMVSDEGRCEPLRNNNSQLAHTPVVAKVFPSVASRNAGVQQNEEVKRHDGIAVYAIGRGDLDPDV